MFKNSILIGNLALQVCSGLVLAEKFFASEGLHLLHIYFLR